MADVFVSYKAEDRRRVKPLVEALEADGHSVWWDAHIGGGAAWRHTIETELHGASCVIVVWSKGSVGPEGEFVRDEATRAKQRHVYVPVTIDKIQVPLGFGETQALSLNGWRGNPDDPKYQAVVSAVRRQLGQPSGSTVRQSTRLHIDRRTMVAGSAAAAVAVAGLGAWAFLRSGTASAARSIAVLPFANLSGDASQAYFSDGIAEELRSALARIPDLKVVARTSCEAVRNDDVKTAAQKLDVGNVLTGSVRRSPSTIRVSTQLVDGSTGLERWSQTFDSPLGDALKIQTSIAENVAHTLSIQLGEAGKAALTLGGTTNAQAHDLVLQVDPGRGEDSEQGLLRALAALDTAIQLDPNYAEAYAKKALTLNYYSSVYARTPADMARGIDDAKSAAQKAIALAPRLPLGHSALATVLKNRLMFKPAFAAEREAAMLPGSDVLTLRIYATSLAQLGRFDEARAVMAKAGPLDPLSPGNYETQARIDFLARRFADALGNARKSLEFGKNRSGARSLLASCLFALGRYPEAEAEFERLPLTDAHGLMGMAAVAAVSGDRGKSDTLIAKLRDTYGDGVSYQLAQVYAQRREADLAITSLNRAIAIRDPGLAGIQRDPFLDPLRGDPRLAAIIRRLDFPT